MQQLEANQQDPTLENIVLLADRNTSVQQWSRPTVRLYRSAILFHIENQRIAGIISSEDAAKFEKLLKSLKGRPGRSERTSAKKAKHANELAIKRLAEKLDSSRSTVAVLAKGLFLSSVMVGLRPAEWFSAQLDDDKLVVKNGKSTNGRGTGEYRTIDLRTPVLMIDRQKIKFIENTLSIIQAASSPDKSNAELMTDIRQVVRRCGITSGGRNITIYTARHQFSANMKAAGLSKREIANLMGHASPNTASTHYGRGVSGHQSFRQRKAPGVVMENRT